MLALPSMLWILLVWRTNWVRSSERVICITLHKRVDERKDMRCTRRSSLAVLEVLQIADHYLHFLPSQRNPHQLHVRTSHARYVHPSSIFVLPDKKLTSALQHTLYEQLLKVRSASSCRRVFRVSFAGGAESCFEVYERKEKEFVSCTPTFLIYCLVVVFLYIVLPFRRAADLRKSAKQRQRR